MLKPVKSILFATDLTSNCQQAFDFTVDVATRLNATIYMLYVVEELSEHVDERVKGLIGIHKWEEMIDTKKMMARKSLLGKTPSSSVIKEAIYNFCKNEDIDDLSVDLKSREIIIAYGDIGQEILGNAEKNDCDLIVLGGHKNLFSKTSVGSTAKSVLKKSKIPVTMVPPLES